MCVRWKIISYKYTESPVLKYSWAANSRIDSKYMIYRTSFAYLPASGRRWPICIVVFLSPGLTAILTLSVPEEVEVLRSLRGFLASVLMWLLNPHRWPDFNIESYRSYDDEYAPNLRQSVLFKANSLGAFWTQLIPRVLASSHSVCGEDLCSCFSPIPKWKHDIVMLFVCFLFI